MGGVNFVEFAQVAQHEVALHGGEPTSGVELKTFVQGGNAAD